MSPRLALALALTAFGLAGGPAAASNFCEADGKKYSIHSTRCLAGRQLRCVAKDEWKEIGACPAEAPAAGSRFCAHGGKQYSIHSTRCEAGRKLRCVAADQWREIGACPN